MLQAGAGQGFQVAVAQVVVGGGALVLVGEVDAFDTFVVGGQGDRHSERAVGREGVVPAGDLEDLLVAGEVDFHHHVPVGHGAHQGRPVVLAEYVGAVPD